MIITLALLMSACAYNVKEVDMTTLKGPITGLSAVERIIPDDPVFRVGLLEDKFISTGNYQVVLAKLPGALINEMLAYTYAWPHGVAFNKRTGESYRVQSMYAGTKGGFAGIPCGRYLEVIIEGLSSLSPDVVVGIGSARGDQWFDLRGNSIPFTQQDYLAGRWNKITDMGTSLNKVFAAYQNNDLSEFKKRIKSWAAVGRYEIIDASDASKKWYLITPYDAPSGGADIIKELSAIKEKYSAINKIVAAADGIVVSSSLEVTALSVAIAAINIPFMKEHTANEFDMATMAERLDAETKTINGCVRDIQYVPVPLETQIEQQQRQ
jgi:ABC-type Fe3+-hydroxamate transport system substrate-binding protein